MVYTVHYLKRGLWIRALEFVEPSKTTKRTKLVDGKVVKPVRRESFEEAEKAAAPFFEKGYVVKITEVK